MKYAYICPVQKGEGGGGVPERGPNVLGNRDEFQSNRAILFRSSFV